MTTREWLQAVAKEAGLQYAVSRAHLYGAARPRLIGGKMSGEITAGSGSQADDLQELCRRIASAVQRVEAMEVCPEEVQHG